MAKVDLTMCAWFGSSHKTRLTYTNASGAKLQHRISLRAIVQQLAYAMQNQNQEVIQMMESQNQLIMQMREERGVGGGGRKGGGGCMS